MRTRKLYAATWCAPRFVLETSHVSHSQQRVYTECAGAAQCLQLLQLSALQSRSTNARSSRGSVRPKWVAVHCVRLPARTCWHGMLCGVWRSSRRCWCRRCRGRKGKANAARCRVGTLRPDARCALARAQKQQALLGQMLQEGYGCKADTPAGKEWADKARRRGYRMSGVYCEL